MTIKVYSYDKDNNLVGVITETNVQIIHFEDQRDVNNGMWIHLGKLKEKSCSIEFDPDYDTFMIYE